MTSTDTTTNTSADTATPVAPAPVTWFEVHSADPGRAKAFYRDVFGWAFDDSTPGYTMINLGDGAPIQGGLVPTDGDTPNDSLFFVQVPDVAAALATVKAHGGSVVTDAQSTPDGLTFGYGANPDGSVFGLWCPPG